MVALGDTDESRSRARKWDSMTSEERAEYLVKYKDAGNKR